MDVLVPILLLGLALACAQESPGRGEAQATLVLTGARIYTSPDDDPIEAGIVVVRDGRIAEVGPRREPPAGATVIDCTGQVLTAGFWNSHVHFTERRWEQAATAPAAALTDHLRRMLVQYGFTSVVDTGSYWPITTALRRRINAGEVPGPRILTTGEILFPKGGAPPAAAVKGLDLIPGAMPEVGTSEEAATHARVILERGADAIKLYVATWWNDPPARMSAEVVRAAADEAHRRGKPVLAHPSNIQGIEAALDGGVDVIVHTTPAAGPWTDALVARMRQRRLALVPTLKLWRAELLREGVPEAQGRAFQRAAADQLRAFVRAGGEVLFGTDVGYMRDADTREEFELMATAGMDYRQILASLTTAPAGRFSGAGRSGRIAPGEIADLVLLDADPALPHAQGAGAAAFAQVARVIREGRIIYTRAPGARD
jgi:imidazolonepropionase-like amidohydrolase